MRYAKVGSHLMLNEPSDRYRSRTYNTMDTLVTARYNYCQLLSGYYHVAVVYFQQTLSSCLPYEDN